MKRLARKLMSAFYYLKVHAMFRIYGIDYIVRELAHCPTFRIHKLLRKHGAQIGESVNFKDGLQLDNVTGDDDATGDFRNLRIGDHCYIGKGVFFDLPRRVTIGTECAISAGAKFITHADCGKRPMSHWYKRACGEITIGPGSWIGVDAVILKGVELGQCCVVAAGAVVIKSFPAYSVIAGLPGRLVNKLEVRAAS